MSHITINGKQYETVKDEEGTVRFKPNNLITKLRIMLDIKATQVLKMYELDAITQMDLLDYYAGNGHTLSGVLELSFFEDLTIEF